MGGKFISSVDSAARREAGGVMRVSIRVDPLGLRDRDGARPWEKRQAKVGTERPRPVNASAERRASKPQSRDATTEANFMVKPTLGAGDSGALTIWLTDSTKIWPHSKQVFC